MGGGAGREGVRSFFYYFLSRHTMQAARLVARTLLRARAPASRLVCLRTTGSCFFSVFHNFCPSRHLPPSLVQAPPMRKRLEGRKHQGAVAGHKGAVACSREVGDLMLLLRHEILECSPYSVLVVFFWLCKCNISPFFYQLS